MQIKTQYIKEQLAKTVCYKCGASLADAKFTAISEVPVAIIGHTVCPSCQAESMVTITFTGMGSIPVLTDFTGNEFKKNFNAQNITVDELLKVHKTLKRKSIWKLLQQKELSSKKEQEN